MKKFLLELFENKIFKKDNLKEFIERFFHILEVFKKVQMNSNSYKLLVNSILFVKVYNIKILKVKIIK